MGRLGDEKVMDEKEAPVLNLTKRRYLRVDEVARYFGVSDRTIYRLVDLGDLKVIRLRDCIRISVEEVREFETKDKEDF